MAVILPVPSFLVSLSFCRLDITVPAARWYQAVTLVYYVDMPQKEAAKQMGVTLYALEGMLKRARKWMIKRYKDEYDRLHNT